MSRLNIAKRQSRLVSVLCTTATLALGLHCGTALADDALAKKATNPIGDMIQVQLQNQYSPNSWGVDGHSNAAIVQPVVPFDLPFESMPKMITRTTIPYVTTADLPATGRVNGLGDTVFLGFGLPKMKSKGVMVGIGPALLLPTATKDETGTGKWAAGPAAVYINMQHKKSMWGAMAYGLWDFAGDSDRSYVSQINIQPILNKYFAGGWYLGLQDVPWAYTNGKWNVPIGPRFGKVTKLGSQHLNVFGGTYYNPVNTDGTAKWSFKLSVSLLFPQ